MLRWSSLHHNLRVIHRLALSAAVDLFVSCITPAVCMEPPDASLCIRLVLFPPYRLTGAPFILCFVCCTSLSGKMIKEAFVEAADSLFQDFRNKPVMSSSIKFHQLSRSTVTQCCEGMAKDLTQQLQRNIAECERFSLQLDESTDASDTAQMCIFVWMVFTDMTAKEELLTLLPMKERTAVRGHFSGIRKFH